MALWADRLAKLAQALAVAGTVPDTSISTAETDTSLRLAPDGAGAVEFVAGGAAVPEPWMLVPDSGTERNSALNLGANNRIILVPATLNVATTLTGVRIVVVNSSGTISVALYDSAATPARLATSGSVACPSAGRADVAFTGNYSAAAGRYYLALSSSTTAATFAAVVVTGTGMLGRFMETAHPAPATVTFAGETNNTMCIVGRISGGYP